MKIKKEWIVGIVSALVVGLLGFIATTVWDGVQIAEKNEVRLEMMKEAQAELKDDVKELRRELYAVYPVISEVAEGANVGTGVE